MITIKPRQPQEPAVIKNDKRGKMPHLIQRVPEYQRLGIDPIQMLKDRAEEVLPTANAFHARGKAIPRLNQDFPKQKQVSIGAKPNNFWLDNNDNVDVDALQGLNPLQPQAKATVMKNAQPQAQQYEAPQVQQYEEEVIQEADESDELIQPGQYILLVSGKTITSGSLEDIEAAVSSMYFNENYNFKPEDFVVLKRVNVKIGVMVADGGR
jgi:hypothetical protein